MVFKKAQTSRLILGAKFNDAHNSEQLKVAFAALEKGLWFHSSLHYSLEHKNFIRKLQEQSSGTTNTIVKIDVNHPQRKETIAYQVEQYLKETKTQQIQVVQLCANPPAHTLKQDGDVAMKLKKLQQEGKIKTVYPEVFWQYSNNLSETLDYNVFSGFVFYHSLIHRDITTDFYNKLKEKNISHIALKGIGSGAEFFFKSQEKEQAIKALMHKCGIDDIIKFRLLYTKSVREAEGLVIATTNYNHFEKLYSIISSSEELPLEIINEIEKLHEIWWRDQGVGEGLGLHNPIGRMGIKILLNNIKDRAKATVKGKSPSYYW